MNRQPKLDSEVFVVTKGGWGVLNYLGCNRKKLFWEFSRKRILEGEKAEAKLSCMWVPLCCPAVCLHCSQRALALAPAPAQGGRQDDLETSGLSSLQLCPEKKRLLMANPALIFSREGSDCPVGHVTMAGDLRDNNCQSVRTHLGFRNLCCFQSETSLSTDRQTEAQEKGLGHHPVTSVQ